MILKVVVTRSVAMPSSLKEIVPAKMIIAHRLTAANISGFGKEVLPAAVRMMPETKFARNIPTTRTNMAAITFGM